MGNKLVVNPKKGKRNKSKFKTEHCSICLPWLSVRRGVGLKGWSVVSMASTWAGPGAETSGLPGAGDREREVTGL